MSVYLVGAGCGSPGLLTLFAAETIAGARHIVYDRLIHPDLLQMAPKECEFYLVGKKENNHTLSQDGINELLVRLGRSGDTVVRLKGGDPFVFGRGGEEAEFLEKNGVPWRAIPGVTAAIGGALCAGLPVTHRDVASAVTLATGHRRFGADTDEEELFWKDIAETNGTVALYMGTSNFMGVAERLVYHGMPPQTPVSVIQWGGWGRAARIDGTLEDMGRTARDGGLPSPSIIYIGDAARVRVVPAPGKLQGMQIQICRPYPKCWEVGRSLEAMGADCYGLPLLSPEPILLDSETRSELERADWLVITSPRGAPELKEIVEDLRRIRARVVSIGEGTSSSLRSMGIVPDYTAGGSSEELAKILRTFVMPGERVLFARNERASDTAFDAVASRGAVPISLSTYRMTPREVPGLEIMREQWMSCGVDAVIFGSSALVEEYERVIGTPPESAAVIAWGTVCADAVRANFRREALKMTTPDMEGLVRVLERVHQQL
ncbi:MAG: uroporphyrinogen-III C-methyltransferase [Synergistaceae bacterium]|jgi:uroporphyrinogen III methyltransferase/synthase|nr:uroporphyrinogen-III C-methyltransferase [Synergistaceae bacterium]